MNLTNIIQKSIDFYADKSKADTILNETINWIGNNTLGLAQNVADLPTKTGYNILVSAINDYPQLFRFYAQRHYNQAVHSAAGYTFTASVMGTQNSIWALVNNFDLYQDILFNLPKSFAKEKVKQFFNAKYAMGRIDGNDAILMYLNGKLSRDYLLDNLMLIHGIPATDAQNLITLKLNQTQIPDFQTIYQMYKGNMINLNQAQNWLKQKYGFSEATTQMMFAFEDVQTQIPDLKSIWRLWKKGLISEQVAYTWAQQKYGYSKQMIDIWFEDFNFDASWSDVMNLSMLIPLPSDWVDKAFDRAGFSDADKALFKSAIEKKIIRDEIRSFWSILLQLYAKGYYTDTQLEELLVKWKFTPDEIAIRLETAQIYRDKNVLENMKEAELYLYRRGIQDENSTYAKLVAMGISEDVANSIVRLEASKKGIDWEIEET